MENEMRVKVVDESDVGTGSGGAGGPLVDDAVDEVGVDWTLEVEPWAEPVEGAVLLEELAGVMRRFVVLPKWADTTLALWTLHTYAFQLREVSTYVGVESPEKRCGKTTLLTVLSELVHRPIVAANISSPAFFRVIQETRPTLLIDEADTFLQGNDELRGILNSGYSRKTAYVVRVANQRGGEFSMAKNNAPPLPNPLLRSTEERGISESDKQRSGELTMGDLRLTSGQGGRAGKENSDAGGHGMEPGTGNTERGVTEGPQGKGRGSRLARFSCWCPKVMAAIGRLPDTLADRCIVIRMQRKTAREECERLRNLAAGPLRRRCARFVRDHGNAIAAARPEIPASLNDRAADIWEPLLVLADLAGGPWPEQARAAAMGLATRAQEQNPIGSLLLDILVVFTVINRERVFSRELVLRLNWRGDRPWNELNRGREITELWLSRQLRAYGVRPRNIWINGEQAKGYARGDFDEVFHRYIAPSEIEAWVAEAREVVAEAGDQQSVVGEQAAGESDRAAEGDR